MIVLFTPHTASSNLGDEIIHLYVKRFLRNIHPDEQIIELPSQLLFFSRRANKHLRNASKIYIGGSNLFSMRFPRIHQFAGIVPLILSRKKVVLLGVGQHSYEPRRWPLNKLLWTSVLDDSSIHLLRDQQCCESILSLGRNALNSGCITLSAVVPFVVHNLEKIENIVFTLTYYRENIDRDKAFVQYLYSLEKNIYFWPQDYQDIEYLKSLRSDCNFNYLEPNIESFTVALDSNSMYIGTRLHAGIHALNLKVPSFIYLIDNRSIEMKKDQRIIGFESLDNLNELLKKNNYNYEKNNQ